MSEEGPDIEASVKELTGVVKKIEENLNPGQTSRRKMAEGFVLVISLLIVGYVLYILLHSGLYHMALIYSLVGFLYFIYLKKMPKKYLKKLPPGFIILITLIVFIFHIIWVILLFTNPAKDCGDVTFTGCSQPWLYYGNDDNTVDDTNIDYSYTDYIFDMSTWSNPGVKKNKGNKCHALPSGKKGIILDGCEKGSGNIGMTDCVEPSEKWFAFSEIGNAKGHISHGKPTPISYSIPLSYTSLGTPSLISIQQFLNDEPGISSMDELKKSPDYGMCLKRIYKGVQADYEDVNPFDCVGSYSDCMNQSTYFATVQWNQPTQGIAPVYPNQLFTITGLGGNNIDFPVPTNPYKISSCNPDSLYNNNYQNPICGESGTCKFEYPIPSAFINSEPQTLTTVRTAGNQNICSGKIHNTIQIISKKKTTSADIKKDMDISNAGTTPLAEVPKRWLQGVDTLRHECLASDIDQSTSAGKCYLKSSICTTHKGGNPVSHIPIIDDHNKLTVPYLSTIGCQNAMIPCSKADEDCDAMYIDNNGYILTTDGKCKGTTWTSNGWKEDSTSTTNKCWAVLPAKALPAGGWPNVKYTSPVHKAGDGNIVMNDTPDLCSPVGNNLDNLTTTIPPLKVSSEPRCPLK